MYYMTAVAIIAYYFVTHYTKINSWTGITAFVIAVLVIFFGSNNK